MKSGEFECRPPLPLPLSSTHSASIPTSVTAAPTQTSPKLRRTLSTSVFPTVRDSITDASVIPEWQQVAQTAGIKFDDYMPEGAPAWDQTALSLVPQLVADGLLSYVEGGNEEDDCVRDREWELACVDCTVPATGLGHRPGVWPARDQYELRLGLDGSQQLGGRLSERRRPFSVRELRQRAHLRERRADAGFRDPGAEFRRQACRQSAAGHHHRIRLADEPVPA